MDKPIETITEAHNKRYKKWVKNNYKTTPPTPMITSRQLSDNKKENHKKIRFTVLDEKR